MKITTEILKKYKDGQLGIENTLGTYCGEIERVWIDGKILNVKFKWLATKGSMKGDKRWYADFEKDYSRNLETLSFWVDGDCLFYKNLSGEKGTFFPPGKPFLELNKVRGRKYFKDKNK